MKILLVENSRTARAYLSQFLEKEGYSIDSVSTGSEAIDAVLKNDYDLLIMDVFMPEMNGYEATQKIRAIKNNKANLHIIAFSSTTSERDKRICLEAGMNEFILKTENNAELLDALRRYQAQNV